MPKTQLTDIAIRALRPPESGQVIYWDEHLPGFGCRVSQGGQKTFVVMYGPREARRRKVVGKYPLQSLKEARDRARKLQAQITLGTLDEPKKVSLTFEVACIRFLKATAQRVRSRTVKDYERLLNRHFAFGKKKLSDITKQDLQDRLSNLREVPSERMHADTAIRVFFNWAYREELIDSNPADRLPQVPKTAARDRVLSDDEIAEVYGNAKTFPWPFGPIVSLCILTGQRRGEIGMLEWDWIDCDERVITLPGNKVKNGRTHAFPIGDIAADLLRSLPRFDAFVFSGRNRSNETFNGWSKSKKAFDKMLDGVGPYTLHDLRRTFSTIHAKIGTPIHVTERILNHATGSISGVAAIYNRHTYFEEMRDAVTSYEAFLKFIDP